MTTLLSIFRNCPGWIAILFGAAGLMRWGL
jgi:hypothetical protein